MAAKKKSSKKKRKPITIEHDNREHARNSPSSAHRWMNCPGCINACEDIPEKPKGAAAADGELAHEYGEKILRKEAKLSAVKDRSMKASVETYVKHCKSYIKEYKPKKKNVIIEGKISLQHLGVDVWGTLDFGIWAPNRTVLVTDFKNGLQVVEAKNNTQLKIYLTGLAEKIGYDYPSYGGCIVQPRASHSQGPVRYHYYKGSELKSFRDEIVKAAKKTEDPNAKRISGSWCDWCLAKTECGTFKQQVQQLTKIEFSKTSNKLPTPKKPSQLKDKEIEKILELTPSIKHWLDDVANEADKRLQSVKNNITKFKRVRTGSRSYWQSDDKFDDLVVEHIPERQQDKCYNVKPKSITDMKALLKQIKKLSEKEAVELLNEYTNKSKGGTTVAPIDDSRTSIISAAIEFKNIK